MTNFFMTLRGFIKKELKQTLRDPRMRMLLFVAPIFQLTVFGVALSNETRNIRLAAVFEPGDVTASDIYTRAIATTWFKGASVQGNDPFEWIRSGQADAVIVAPPGGLTAQIQRGRGDLQVLINAQNSLRAQAIENYLLAITRQLTADPQNSSGPLLNFDVRAMFNPTFETSIYMVPGVMSMLVCLVTIILTSMSVARERELGTLETLIASPISSLELLLGKTVPFVILGMVQVPLILTAAVILFNLPVRGSLLYFFGAAFFFILNTVSIGLLISTIAKNQQQSMLGGFLFLFPAVLLSGLMFPIENMPFYMKILSQLDPLTHFIGLLRNILLKGASPQYFFTHVGALAVSAFVFIFIASKRFRTTI